MHPYLVGITGASGSLYGIRLIRALRDAGRDVHVVASAWGDRVTEEETGRTVASWCAEIGGCRLHAAEDLAAPVASGSFRLAGTVLLPCSMASVAALATGSVRNLIHRAGAVALKEGWPLIVAPRESPLSQIDLKNLVALAEAGAMILPAAPGFYHHPTTIEDLVDQVVGKVLDRLGIEHSLFPRWNGGNPSRSSS